MANVGLPHVQINGQEQTVLDSGNTSPTLSSNTPVMSPGRNKNFSPTLNRRVSHNTLILDEYFRGPMDLGHHSRWPMFMRIHGSVLPKMIVPLVFVAAWSTAVTCISVYVHVIGINPVLLTVLGFVVGMALSFRTSTAYERYNEGRKYWAQLQVTARNAGRLIWIHAGERHDDPVNPEQGKVDVLGKMTALNLINAFAVSLKHRLRFEPSTDYPDLEPLIEHLDTFASRADKSVLHAKKSHILRSVGEYLGLPFATPNPRKLMKASPENLGNVPLEVLSYLSSYIEGLFEAGQLKTPTHQSTAMAILGTFTDVLTGTERIVNTPLPMAYNIAISQIAWVYVLVLPFQLFNVLKWITIPGSIVAAYIILGMAAIGQEIENPFGEDVNDLPLEDYCREIAADLDALMSSPRPKHDDWIETANNKVLYPMSMTDYQSWKSRSLEQIRAALKAKATINSKNVMLARVRSMVESDLLEV